MKLLLSNSQYRQNLSKMKLQNSGQYKAKKYNIQDKYDKINVNTNRPAQAPSFSGSAVPWIEKFANSFIENNFINKLIGIVKGNEAAFNAGYALIVAGMLKPGLVLAQTGFNDKDGQMIATKNFLQAFIGFFLGLTIGGGFIKKIWDSMETNFRLSKVKEFKNGGIKILPRDIEDKNVQDVAKGMLVKEHSKFKDKHSYAKSKLSNTQGFARIKEYLYHYKEYKYTPEQEDINIRAKFILNNLKKNHIDIFNSNQNVKEFCKRLIESLEFITDDPAAAKVLIPKDLKAHVWDSFESVNKNITNVPTVIAKAKISSLLLPAAVAAIFANRASKSKNSEDNNKTKIQENSNNNKPSFKGSLKANALMKCTRAFEKLAVSNFGESFTNLASKISPTPSRLMSQIESFGITFYWLINTHFSPKIDPDQKLGLNVHTALVTLVSCIASILVDGGTDTIINKAEETYLKKVKSSALNKLEEYKLAGKNLNSTAAAEIAEQVKSECKNLYNSQSIYRNLANVKVLSSEQEITKVAGNLAALYGKHLKKLKSLTIFTLVVRFLVPVLTVKQSKKIKKALIEFSKNKAQKNKEKVNQ